MKRLWIDALGAIIDIWHIKAVEPYDEYNDVLCQMDYNLIINKDATNSDIKDRIFRFTDKDERDDAIFQIKEAISNSPGMYFVGETDGAIEDEDMKYRNKKPPADYDEEPTGDEEEEEEHDDDLDGPTFEE